MNIISDPVGLQHSIIGPDLSGDRDCDLAGYAERTKAALAVKRANGQRISRTPYGFDLAPDGRSLVKNPAEQAVIADILAMRERGMSMPKIAEALSERGVPTKRGNGAWRHETIGGLIRRHNGIASTPKTPFFDRKSGTQKCP